jgi:hypothetical protein
MELLHAAATITAAVIDNFPDTLTADQDPKKLTPEVMAEDLEAWKILHVWYHGLLSALKDENGWPSPPADKTIPGLAELLAKLGGGIPGSPAVPAPAA